MRIEKEKGTFIEAAISGPGKVSIIIGAKDKDNNLKTIINSAEITTDEFIALVKGVGLPIL